MFGLWGQGRPQPRVVGFAGPGAVTGWGLPISQLAVVVAAVGTVGMLVTAIMLPRRNGEFGDEARRCLASASRLALVWAVATVALLVFSWSDFTRLPVARATIDGVFGGHRPDPNTIPYLFAAVLAVLIAGAAYVIRTAAGVMVVLLLAAYNVLPLTTRGHEVGGSLIGVAVTMHVIAMAVWVGGLAGLLLHVRRSPTSLAVAVPRFSRLALVCLGAVAASGLIAAWVQLGSLSELGTSHYGTLVIYKAEALVALGILGWWHRRRTVPDVGEGSRHGFTRFAALEAVVIAATIALGVALSRTPAPAAPVPTTPATGTYTGVSAPLGPPLDLSTTPH